MPTFGRGVVYDVDQRIRSEQFRFVADALRTAKLRTYVPAFKQARAGGGRQAGRRDAARVLALHPLRGSGLPTHPAPTPLSPRPSPPLLMAPHRRRRSILESGATAVSWT